MKSRGNNCKKAHDVLNYHINYSQALTQFKPQHSLLLFFFFKCCYKNLSFHTFLKKFFLRYKNPSFPVRNEDYQRRALTWLNWFSKKVLQGIYFCFHVWRTRVKVKALFITAHPCHLCTKTGIHQLPSDPSQSVRLAALKVSRHFALSVTSLKALQVSFLPPVFLKSRTFNLLLLFFPAGQVKIYGKSMESKPMTVFPPLCQNKTKGLHRTYGTRKPVLQCGDVS